jgi:hypothetical protein
MTASGFGGGSRISLVAALLLLVISLSSSSTSWSTGLQWNGDDSIVVEGKKLFNFISLCLLYPSPVVLRICRTECEYYVACQPSVEQLVKKWFADLRLAKKCHTQSQCLGNSTR